MVITDTGRVVQRVAIGAPLWTVTIGRGHQCEVRIDNRTVSRRHAQLLHSDNGLMIRDAKSASGTYVASKLIREHILRVGDVVRVGQVSIHFEHVITDERADTPGSARALLTSVLTAPESMAPRQVYGDWLAERGDPRGEFIQVQIAAAGLTVDDPRLASLHARARQLLSEHEARWVAPLPSPVESWTFACGFIESVRLSHDAHTEAAARELASYHPIRHIRSLGEI